MANRYSSHVPAGIGLGYITSATRTAFALDTAFTLGSAGKCVAFRFVAPATTTVTDFLFFLSAAPAGAHDLSVNLCAYSASLQPGAAVTNGTATVSGGTTANKWIKVTFGTPPSITAGTVYFLVVGDPSGAASNYSILTIGTHQGLTGIAPNSGAGQWRSVSSADGFATTGATVSVMAPACIAFGDGTYMGMPYTLTPTTDASAAVERGWLITPDEDITISYMVAATMPTGSMKVYESGQNPGGTVFAGFNGGSAFSIPASAVAIGAVRFPVCALVGGAQYRVVIDPTGATTSPGYTQIEDDTTHSAILEACGFPGISMQHTEESGGAWVDSPSKLPRLFLGIDQLPAQAAGGGFPVLGGSVVR